MRRPSSTTAVVALLVVLAACTPETQRSDLAPALPPSAPAPEPPRTDAAPDVTRTVMAPAGIHLECVVYARQRTGFEISGDAWTWWRNAQGRYKRSNKPSQDAVLVLKRTNRLPQGHVAVVSAVVGPREIRVDHSNWDDRRTRGRIYENMSVIDVSPRNDWTMLRFWNGGDYGRTYSAYGFIESPPAPADAQRQASR